MNKLENGLLLFVYYTKKAAQSIYRQENISEIFYIVALHVLL